MSRLRIDDGTIEATYRTRDRYLRVCERNLRGIEKETFRKYSRAQRGLRIPLFTEKLWARAQQRRANHMRKVIAANQHAPF